MPYANAVCCEQSIGAHVDMLPKRASLLADLSSSYGSRESGHADIQLDR